MNRGFTCHRGVLAPLLRPNIDTDAIIPSREMKTVGREGLGAGLFAGWRYREGGDREPDPEFVLNQDRYAGASVLAAGPNFGCGSSREHAVWALLDFGIRSVIAPSFGGIFERNCVNNGLLPLRLDGGEIQQLLDHTEPDPQDRPVAVDLEALEIRAPGGLALPFVLHPLHREMLLAGQDPIDLTLGRLEEIQRFEQRDRRLRPWAWPERTPAPGN